MGGSQNCYQQGAKMQSSFWTRFEISFRIYAKIFSIYNSSVIYEGKPAQVLTFLIRIRNMFASNFGRDADHAE